MRARLEEAHALLIDHWAACKPIAVVRQTQTTVGSLAKVVYQRLPKSVVALDAQAAK
jgi:hypothetical protein